MPRCPVCLQSYVDGVSVCPIDGARLDGPQGDSWIGKMLGGKLRILKQLGVGGMGEVYLAQHEFLGRPAAVKVVRRDLTADPAMAKRFLREAQICSRMENPHVVAISDFGLADDGRYYLVMEYLEGTRLDDVLRRDGPLAVGRAVHIAAQIACGLAAAHARQIVHRDLKPQNVQLVPTRGDPDFVKVLDFGLARIVGGERQTATGEVVGTPVYMAPEQFARSAVDHRADLYSLGVVLYELLTGRPPFTGSLAHVMLAHQAVEAEPPSRSRPEVPRALDEAVRRCLAKQPDHRFASATELEQALHAIEPPRIRRESGPVLAAPSPAPPPRLPPGEETQPSVSHRIHSVRPADVALLETLPAMPRSASTESMRTAEDTSADDLRIARHRRILELALARWSSSARPAAVAELLDGLRIAEARLEEVETQLALARAVVEERIEEASGSGTPADEWPGMEEARAAARAHEESVRAGRDRLRRLLDRLRDAVLSGVSESDTRLGTLVRDLRSVDDQLAVRGEATPRDERGGAR